MSIDSDKFYNLFSYYINIFSMEKYVITLTHAVFCIIFVFISSSEM